MTVKSTGRSTAKKTVEEQVFLIAYDVGLLCQWTAEAIGLAISKNLLKPQSESTPGGLISGVRVGTVASQVAWHKAGGAKAQRPVGVFIGDTCVKLFEDPELITLYCAFHVRVDSFSRGDAASTRRSTGAQHQQQDRGGFRTFRRGDIVVFQVQPPATSQSRAPP